MGHSEDWQKIDPDLRTHPAFAHLSALLGLSPMTTHGLLAGLWAMAYRQASDGDLTRFKPGAIASAIGYEGNAREMLAALVEAGFLESDEESLRIHDWGDWGGALFVWQARENERKREWRKRHSRATVVSPSCDGDATACDVTRRRRSKNKVKNIDALPGVDVVETVKVESLATSGFAVFWKAYPNKQGKVPAERRWRGMKPGQRAQADLAAIAMAGAVEHGYRERDKCPHGSTFLNQRRYEEWFDEGGELAPPPGYGPNGSKPSTNLTTEQARPTCVVCAHVLTADEQMEAVHTRKGWRHESCVREEP